jgi:hypothetical protein
MGGLPYNGDIDSFLDGTSERSVAVFKYRDVRSPSEDFTQSSCETGYLVIGSETQATALGNFTTTSYTAMLQADIFPSTGFVSIQNRAEMRSEELVLTANFEDGSITGIANNIGLRSLVSGGATPGFTSLDGSLVFSNGTIAGSDFTGIFTANDRLKEQAQVINISGEFSGSFYGTEAQTIGGVISGTSTNSTGRVSNITGGFASN